MSGWRSQEERTGEGERSHHCDERPLLPRKGEARVLPYLCEGEAGGYQAHSESVTLLAFRDHKTDGRLFYLFIFGRDESSLLGGFSLVGEWGLFSSRIVQAYCGSFSCSPRGCRPCGLQVAAHGLSSYSSQALVHRLSSCGA